MSLSLDIRPFSSDLSMHGDASPSSAFSLAGHVSISITPSKSWFCRPRKTTRLLLQSLVITFEGKSEVITPVTGYASVRLCSIARELVRGDPIEISDEGQNDPCSWDVVFDIPVPGWLPTTSTYGDIDFEETGTRYALYATATYTHQEDSSSSYSWSSFCTPFHPRSRTAVAPMCPIVLRRLVEPPAAPASTFPMSMYLVEARPASPAIGLLEVFRKMEVVASIPAAISMDDTSVPLSLRLRGKDMTDDERESLRVTGFSVDIEQVEVYRNATNEDHIYRYPILPKQCQPPNQPLRDPHPIHTLYAIGAIVAPPPSKSSTGRIFSLLPKDNGGRYTIGGDNRVFASTGHPASGSECYVLDVNIPITKEPYESDWAGSRMRRLTESSPLFSVRHILRVSVQCVYQDGEGQEPVHQQLHFCLPLRLVHLSAISAECHPAWSSTDAQDKLPYIHTLPAYSQLFHPNGDRKVDYSTPLPLYEPPPSPSSSSFTPSEDHQKTQ